MRISTDHLLRASWLRASGLQSTAPRAAMGASRLRTIGLALLAALTAWVGLIASPSPARAQEVLRAASPRSGPVGRARVRVVATFDPETGNRSWEVLAPLSPSEILWIQEALSRAGHPSADAPGQLRSATREALRRFQRDRGLETCGCPSYETMVALGLEPQVVLTVVRSSATEGAASDRAARGERAVTGDRGTTGAAQVEVIYPPSPPPGAAEGGGSETANTGEAHAGGEPAERGETRDRSEANGYGGDLATSYFGLSHTGLILIPAGHELHFFGLHHPGDSPDHLGTGGLHRPGSDRVRHLGPFGPNHSRLPSFQRVPFPPGRLSPPGGRLSPPNRFSGTPFHSGGH